MLGTTLSHLCQVWLPCRTYTLEWAVILESQHLQTNTPITHPTETIKRRYARESETHKNRTTSPMNMPWIGMCNTRSHHVATPLWPSVRTLPKLGTWSPPKTPRIGVFLVSLERSWSVDVPNFLALVIWTSVAQVMSKRRVRSQTGSLTPDH